MWKIILVVFNSVLVFGKLPPPCSSKIFCYGKLLHTVQMSRVFPDSKTFVDMKMKTNESHILESFDDFMKTHDDKPSRDQIRGFVDANFDPPGSEFQHWIPSDWTENPKFFNSIYDLQLRRWAWNLNYIWVELGRKMKDEVYSDPGKFSIIPLPHPVIVPGGRFREIYYWDSYWIIRGLLLCEMFTTAKGMLSNFLFLVDTYGFVPNGGRIYYTMRSQPPLLIPMIESYLQVTKDYDFLSDNIHILEKEFQFWMNNRTIEVPSGGRTFRLAHYADSSSSPRPESYKEDVDTAKYIKDKGNVDAFYSELKSSAESGWDFSSRWFIKDGENTGNLTNTHTTKIIPVDLNAILCWNARLLSEFYKKLKMTEKSAEYAKIAEEWKEAVTEVLWHDDVGSWLDYDVLNKKRRNYFYASNLAPLWTDCYDRSESEHIADRVLNYFDKYKMLDFPGGIPSSLEFTGEQWDYPNSWPPSQYIIIMGLDGTKDTWAKRWAFHLSLKLIHSIYHAYNKTGHMFEKYDATRYGSYGGGGEYDVQLGFGWTNGLVLCLIHKYGDVVTAIEDVHSQSDLISTSASPSSSTMLPLVLFIFLICFQKFNKNT